MNTIAYYGGPIFDGNRLLEDHYAIFTDGYCTHLTSTKTAPNADQRVDLSGDILSPGYTDLQVNGGGGVMLNDNPCMETINTIAAAHRTLGTTHLLPTLITASPDKTKAAIDTAINAIKSGTPGIAGLHLEGPHLSIEKKGAHNPDLIRPMNDSDLQLLLSSAEKLPLLKVTIAPESVTLAQTQTLSKAGILLALGHTNASFDTCMAYRKAGVQCITHLYNAMSQLGSRDPGLVGMALNTDNTMSGLIADGVHVHAATIRATLKSMGERKRIYLVTDAMATAGSSIQSFTLDNRTIYRNEGQLTLDDGTLAGADLELTQAIRFLVNEVGVELTDALRASITHPQQLLGNKAVSLIGLPVSDCIRIRSALTGVTTL